MSIPGTLNNFLAEHAVAYQLVPHPHSNSASRTAEAAHVPGDAVAKAVLLVEEDGQYRLAVVPATRRVKLGQLHRLLGEHVGLATEDEVARVFADCERGAIPALGAAYGLETLLDDSVLEQRNVYFEAGDHESLVRLRETDFLHLLGLPRRGQFSAHI
ncbi:YbaK/prolyl-tRNA synthetase associated protein [Thioalkalivibrio versutus]|uniref:YbaK/prolyl-tRNA synthetase associated protein n=1 Tax=Thioalkalivibrio versutus TaxID=106634 RepID=A0A0G3G9C0_9GAMM|nr:MULTISPECIES: YbaK/EbsC family protein [Thioalkalivibrio]AKJ95436.1 YbaK/prolyl-tRNA synthetase associated protein [Thioalkalivibrio versutus]